MAVDTGTTQLMKSVIKLRATDQVHAGCCIHMSLITDCSSLSLLGWHRTWILWRQLPGFRLSDQLPIRTLPAESSWGDLVSDTLPAASRDALPSASVSLARCALYLRALFYSHRLPLPQRLPQPHLPLRSACCDVVSRRQHSLFASHSVFNRISRRNRRD